MDTYTSFNDLTVSQEVKRKVATFDMTTKRFLAQKDNLAQLLKSCIAEYGCYDPESIAGNFIEPNIAVASTDVFPSIHGMPTEDITPEGDSVTLFFELASYIVHPRLITSEVVRNYPNFFCILYNRRMRCRYVQSGNGNLSGRS